MSGLKNLETRLKYRGGAKQIDRMIADKAWSLKSSLNLSYQSATAVLSDGREFRCLINPNKLSMEQDDKVLSIPFEDICLNNETIGSEPIGIKCGDVIEWKETETHWIIYTQYLQEIAYFRGQMRQCASEPIEINGVKYWYYLKGPDEKGIDWQKSKHFIFNDLNYTLEMYISKTIATKELFHRHSKIKIPFKNELGEIEFRPYEVQAIDDISTQGIMAVYLKEDFNNQWEEPEFITKPEASTPIIIGPNEVYPYDIVEYTSKFTGGEWHLSNRRAKIIDSTESSVKIEITTGKSGSVSLIYRVEGMDDIIYNINILSL